MNKHSRGTPLQKDAHFFKFITGPGTLVMSLVFKTFYSQPDMNSDLGKKCLDDLFDSNKKPEISKRKFKDKLGGRTWSRVKNVNLMKELQDIPFYHKCLTYLNDTLKNKLSSTTLKNIDKLNDHRNNLCHRGKAFSGSVSVIFDELENLYKEILNGAKNDLINPTYLHKTEQEVIQLIKQIRNHSTDEEECIKRLNEFLKHLSKKFIVDAQVELHKQYDGRNLTNSFSWLHKLDLNLYQDSHLVNEIFTAPLLMNGLQKIEHTKLFQQCSRGASEVLIVTGLGGSGKTTLLNLLLTEWTSKSEKTRTVDMISEFDLVCFCELRKTNNKTVSEYLRNELLVDSMKMFPKEYEFDILSNINFLFLIDGFDEKNPNGSDFIQDIASCLPVSQVVLTTRTEYLNEAKAILPQSKSCITISLEGFEEKSRVEFAKKLFFSIIKDKKKRHKIHEEFCNFLNKRAKIFLDHLKLPLTMALLVFLYFENQNNIKMLETINTASQLYQQLYKMLKQKLVKSRVKFRAVSEESVEALFHHLSSRALDQLSNSEGDALKLTNDSRSHVEERFEECILDIKSDSIDFFSAFLVYEEGKAKNSGRKSLTTNEGSFFFFHRVQMEYMSAAYITQEMNKDHSYKLKKFFTHEDKRIYKEIFPFLVGCFSMNEMLNTNSHCTELLKICTDATTSETDYNYWFTILSETTKVDPDTNDLTHDTNLCLRLGHQLRQKNWCLNSETIMSGLQLLIYCTKVQTDLLEIDLQIGSDPKKILDLNIILQKLKNTLTLRCKRPIHLELHVRHHNAIHGRGETDEYIPYFQPWAKLHKITGQIGPESVRHLYNCKDITVKIYSLETFNDFSRNVYKFKRLKK